MKKNIISKSLLSEVAASSIILDVRNEDDVSNAKSYDKVPNSVFVKFDKAAGKISDTNLSMKFIPQPSGFRSAAYSFLPTVAILCRVSRCRPARDLRKDWFQKISQ